MGVSGGAVTRRLGLTVRRPPRQEGGAARARAAYLGTHLCLFAQ